jgi:hypothetical protein
MMETNDGVGSVGHASPFLHLLSLLFFCSFFPNWLNPTKKKEREAHKKMGAEGEGSRKKD